MASNASALALFNQGVQKKAATPKVTKPPGPDRKKLSIAQQLWLATASNILTSEQAINGKFTRTETAAIVDQVKTFQNRWHDDDGRPASSKCDGLVLNC